MLLSMTGFSTLTADLPIKDGKIPLSFELKSVNARFFETSCRLPSSLSYLEHVVTARLKKALVRGKVNLFVRIMGEDTSLEQVIPSLRVAKTYVSAAQDIQKATNIGGTLSINDILSLPNVFTFEKGIITKEQEDAFIKALDQATEILIASRRKEGDGILADLKTIFGRCEKNINEIEVLAQKLIAEKKENIESVAAKAHGGDVQANMRLEELYKTLDKIDIHEEISRFRSHMQTVNRVLVDEQTIDKGRQFDFIVQELMREINTITAKCSSFPIGSIAVNVKVDVEKSREQIQNVV